MEMTIETNVETTMTMVLPDQYPMVQYLIWLRRIGLAEKYQATMEISRSLSNTSQLFSSVVQQFMAHTADYGTSAIYTNDIAVLWNTEIFSVV